MTYAQPIFSSMQKMNKTSTQSQTAFDLQGAMDSHSTVVAEKQRVSAAASENTRDAMETSATLQGPHLQPVPSYLGDDEGRSVAAVSKGKGKAVQSVVESPELFKDINFNFFELSDLKPTEEEAEEEDDSENKPDLPQSDIVFKYPDLKTWSVPATGSVANTQQPDSQAISSQAPGVNTPSMRSPDIKLPAKKARYYTQALSDTDKHALAIGEKNHNLQPWTPQHLLHHHESRKELVPRALDKADTAKALAAIEHDTQAAQRKILKSTPNLRRRSRLNMQTLANIDEDTASTSNSPQSYSPAAAHFVIDKRSSSAPAPSLRPLCPTHTLQHSIPVLSLHPLNTHIRASSTCAPSSPSPSSSLPSPHPNKTFDAFLAPHKSGKGETHHANANAKTVAKSQKRLQDGAGFTATDRGGEGERVRRFSWEEEEEEEEEEEGEGE